MPEQIKVSSRIGGASCAVIGLGISNIPLVDYLISHGAEKIKVHDRNAPDTTQEHIQRFLAAGVEFICGEHYLDKIDADIIFRSPGVRPWEHGIADACGRGATLTSEMELFFELCPCPIIAITGSDGKTTTTTLTHLLLKREFERTDADRAVFVGGNIGQPLLPRICEIRERDIVVVELSSFQLYTMKKSPEIAVITNLSPNHLDWHTDLDDYYTAKHNIFKANDCKRLITNHDNEVTSKLSDICRVPISWFSHEKHDTPDGISYFEKDGYITRRQNGTDTPILKISDIKIRGRHNIENYMAAIAATDTLVSPDTVGEVAREFGGVEHRIEFVREINGVKYYNSSIDSSPSRSIAALRSFDEPLVVICCGRDKHVPFGDMADELCKRADTVVLWGELAEQLYSAITSSPKYKENSPKLLRAKDMEEAVKLAQDEAKAPQSVLLSPGGTSFDAYKNFEMRGKHFKQIVAETEG